MTAYREYRIFKRRDAGAMIYVCFEDLVTGRFAVQQAEFFYLNENPEIRARQIAGQTLELFLEQDPIERCTWYPSLEEAIAAHDIDFEN